ncbi:probable disease resistance protein RPP1 [Raphanus sativus]|uniref:ADP-ribosyl cyclase/cyclic ADP-ribose hydrolase n=1 Tax=Raphanus sativus TaxID=3726 RepID=A0A6J0JW44_RAPSA|nr:probable disease resistance protein RPP1 [Raphanus sativus]
MDLYLLLVTVSVTIFTLLCTILFSIVYGKSRVQENRVIASSPSSSSSPPSPQSSLPIHDVFPSFHGADVRKYFLSHLLKEFGSKGINLFIDNDITRGEFIGPELKKAIQGSKIAIVLLSKRYASSSWCLDELVEIMKCKEELGQTVMPVFYEVDPTDVKKQAGEFGKVFKETCKGKRNEVIGKWSEALAKVATLAGYHSKNWETDAKMVEDVATDVAVKLFDSTPSRDFDEFIGMEAHMNKISRVLRTDLDEVRMIGIWGPAGIGKTTIARCLFNQLSDTFQYSTFLMNVKAMYTPPICSDDHNVKLLLQQKLLSQLLNQKEEDFKISHLGVARERLNDKKVLVVLDDVDRLVQLEAMAKETWWFGHGSQIIITTQDRKILKAHGITDIYEVNLPSDCEAIQMFCMYAFGQKSPEDGFEKLVREVTRLAGKLPLGLRVMGSYFRGMSKQEWENALPELRRCLNGEIERILMFGYNALSHENKFLFLHIACFFNRGRGRIDRVVEHLSKSFYDVRQQLNVLAEKSLISLESKYVIMHDLLVQLGRDIVRKQSREPGQRQFLVDKRETCEVLADDAAGSRSLIGIKFCGGGEINVSERAFEGMSNLQFLRLRLASDGGGYMFLGYLSRKLRLLDWSYFPMTCLDCIPNPELLVELNMYGSKLEKLWEGTKPLSNLKWVDLSDSKNLKDVSSLSTATSLEELKLTRCSSLVELPSSIGNAIRNVRWKLDFSDCSSLVGVPFSIGNAIHLMHLDFSRCSSLVELPASIGNLHKLNSLILKECCKLEVLPVNINLKSLRRLDLTDCSLMKCFPEISTSIISMFLSGTAIKEVPSSIRLWPHLDELHLSYNENLKEIPFPHVLHTMTGLFMSNTEVQEIPPWINRIYSLRRLVVNGCKELLSLPQLPDSLSEVDAEDCESLERLDCSFLNQKIDLNFANCFKLNKDARDVIIQASSNYSFTILPGKEIPNYFNHQASGCSLVIKLNERPSHSPVIWKACILLVCKDEVEAAERQSMYLFHRIKQNGLEDVPWNGRTNVLSRHLTEHLYIFEFRADVTSDELCFEFMVKEEWTIKECGVHYLNTRYKQVYSRKRKRVETCESGDEVAEEEVDSVRLEE